MDKTTSENAFNALERLKSYTEFESVTVGADGSVTVKYAARQPSKDAREKTDKPRETAIDSLAKQPPTFSFGGK